MTLPLDIYSPDQLSRLVLELHDLSTAARDQAAQQQAGEATLSAELQQLLEANQVAPDDVTAVDALAKEATATLDKALTVHVLLAAAPGRTMKRQFVTWFRAEINPTTLLTFAARSDLGGGAIVQVGSHLYDLSFRRSIIDNKKRLTEIAGV